MAIHPDLPGVEVTICVNGIPLEEFDDPPEEGTPFQPNTTKSISKYVKSMTDQEFTIKYTMGHPFDVDCPNLKVHVCVDGKSVPGKAFDRDRFPGGKIVEGIISGVKYVENGEKMFKTFCFSAVKTTLDDDAYKRVDKDINLMAKVGSIAVTLWRGGDAVRVSRKKDWSAKLRTSDVHEKALKGEPKYHGVSLGDAKPVAFKNTILRTAKLDETPLASFTFKYRSEGKSRVALKELLVIERTPEPEEPSPAPAEAVSFEDLDADQKRKVEEFMRNLKSGSSQAPGIKREFKTEDGPSSQPKRPRRLGEKVTIDLTDD
ncbi:uncharacterized protein LY89DRAFT_724405 [Mollisia scopiformis]|uniref:DUF7918 domain-containing protein n=1 Tax=Mollisia scopiformis TaxID=149040 RepID=A0A132BBM8_MOLSC|nr:uncharacterized protein LY89DRAFT_724405 [Mollisia scopiformis]KUJ09409.1 hypothetical protein LY89DRAFT_724405 [Mollisia scopiformis]